MIHDNNNTSDDPLMAIQLAFHGEDQGHHAEDNHQDDLLMPGFRFHPTDEELIDFYLRRKLEGKSFIIDFIPFINLYSYDPWELPGAESEKPSIGHLDISCFPNRHPVFGELLHENCSNCAVHKMHMTHGWKANEV